MTPRERIRGKLAKCEPYYQMLVELRGELSKPVPDKVTWFAAERNLHLALECAIDVGEMLISMHRLRLAEDNKDVFRILGEAVLLEAGLAHRMAQAAGMRNALVHLYADLDREKVRKAFLHDVKDLKAFAEAVLDLVK